MGKKGKKKGMKQVVMTQQEFFQSQQKDVDNQWDLYKEQELIFTQIQNKNKNQNQIKDEKIDDNKQIQEQKIEESQELLEEVKQDIQEQTKQEIDNDFIIVSEKPKQQPKSNQQQKKQQKPKQQQIKQVQQQNQIKQKKQEEEVVLQKKKDLTPQQILEQYQKYQEKQQKYMNPQFKPQQNLHNFSNQMIPMVNEMPLPQIQPSQQLSFIPTYVQSQSNINSYEQAMNMLQTKTLQEQAIKEHIQQQQQQYDDYYQEDYGEEQKQDFDINNFSVDQLQQMIKDLTLNQNVQLQFDPQQFAQAISLIQNISVEKEQNEIFSQQEIEYEIQQEELKNIQKQNQYQGPMQNFVMPDQLMQNYQQDIQSDSDEDDELIDYFLMNQEKMRACEFFKKGSCRYGDKCKYIHPVEYKKKKDIEYDEECCICMQKVLTNGKQFGILDNCSHTFCLDCIRKWRSTYHKNTTKQHYRTCPICRRNSYLVIPSNEHVMAGEEKDKLIEEYKRALKQIPCKHFNHGQGLCPFTNSCLYMHSLPNGAIYEYPWRDNKINEYGEWEDDQERNLSDMIGNF